MQPFLNGFTLPQIATWPDDFDHSSQGGWSGPMHYVNLPTNATSFLWAYCEKQYTMVGCVATAIQNYSLILDYGVKTGKPSVCVNASSNGVEPCPMSFVTHFVGDVHQPLHVSYEIDEGGNSVDVEFFTSCTNLHSLWDSGMIYHYEDETDSDWEDIAKMLTQTISDYPIQAGNWSETTDPANWANESFQRTRVEPYNFQPGTESPHSTWVKTRSSTCGWQLGQAYYSRNIPYVFDQLMRAGVRLATRLNNLFDPSFTPPLNIIPYQF
jgi:hypothetical protein